MMDAILQAAVPTLFGAAVAALILLGVTLRRERDDA